MAARNHRALNAEDREVIRDAVLERAAIIEEGEQCQRSTAQHAAALSRGFADWFDFVLATRDPDGSQR